MTILLSAVILVRERQQATTFVEHTIRERTSLAHMAVFELRQHLTSLSGLIDGRSEKQEGRTERLRQTLDEVGKALVDVLEVFDVSAGALVIKREPVELRGLVYELIRSAAKRAADTGHPVVIEPGHLPELWVEADPVRIRQCVSTLINQAMRETTYGRVRVSVRSEHLEEEVYRVTFLVKDSSPGMEQEAAIKLFSPAQYAHHTAFSARPAAILPLNLAKQIAEAMGGEISAHSRPGCGTSYFLTIGAVTCPAGDGAHHTGTDQNADRREFEGLRILLVDDNPVNLFVLEEMVMPHGFAHVVSVEGGEAAIKWAQGEHFDIILLDVMMPRVDGWAAARAIRSEGKSKNAAMVAVSADHRCAHDPRLGRLGIGAFVPKPLNHDDLLSAMARALPVPKRLQSEATAKVD
ncbi:MAG: response regulator [Pseudomonadota bacterium]